MENNTNSTTNSTVPASQNSEINAGKKSFSPKVIAAIGLIVLLVILSIGGLFLLKKQNGEQEAKLPPQVEVPENVELATVGDKKIMRDDVAKLALEQVLAPAIDSNVMKNFLNIAVELAILEQEAAVKNIQIPEFTLQKEKYEFLKSEVIKGNVKSVEAYTIDYWIPAEGYPQEPVFEEQRSISPQVIDEAEEMLRAGEDPLAVANAIYEKYSILQNVLAFNGGLMKQAKEKNIELQSAPRVYEYVESEGTFHLQEAVFAMSDGEVEGYIWPDRSGAAIIKVQKVNRGENTNYDLWIAEKKQTVVFNDKNVNNLK